MKKLMSSLHKIYEELPSCANYNNITESNDKEFPMLCVSQRWMENEPVAKKIREISPKIVENVKYWKLLPKNKHPVYGKAGNNISYDHLVASINDPIIPVKMIFCGKVAKKLNEFLTLFQTDQPMAPFLGEAVADLVRFFMEKFILKSVMDKAHSSISLTKIDLNNVTKQKPSCMDLGFTLNNKIKLPKVRKKVTNMIVMLVRFKIEALDFFLAKMCSYSIEKSLLLSYFAKCFRCLSPVFSVQTLLKLLLETIYSNWSILKPLLLLLLTSQNQSITSLNQDSQSTKV